MHGYVSEGRLGITGIILGVSLTSMAGSGAAILCHCLMGFLSRGSLCLQYPFCKACGDG